MGVETPFGLGLVNQSRFGFPAGAAVTWNMRADKKVIDPPSESSCLPDHRIVNCFKPPQRQISPSDTGLVGQNQDDETGFLE
jgi:hypothetical protein